MLALAGDMPYFGSALLRRLASEAPEASALVTLTGGLRNPLFCRYHTRALPGVSRSIAAGRRSLRSVLDALGDEVATLALSSEEEAELADWDTPADVARGRG